MKLHRLGLRAAAHVSTFVTALGSPAGPAAGLLSQAGQAREGKGADRLGRGRRAVRPTAHGAPDQRQSSRAACPGGPARRQVRDSGRAGQRLARVRRPVSRQRLTDPASRRSAIKDPEAEQDEAARLAGRLGTGRPTSSTGPGRLLHLSDGRAERREEYRYVQKWGRAVREAKSVVKVLVVEQTLDAEPAWGDLYGAVDIWCPLFRCTTRRRPPNAGPGRDDLDLHGLVPGEAAPLVAHRFSAAELPRAGVDRLAIPHDGPAVLGRDVVLAGGRRSLDRSQDAGPADQRKGPLYNGEGNLLYPGRAVGYDGIAPSLRLKALRDGIEDYEYLAILQRAGKADEAERTSSPWPIRGSSGRRTRPPTRGPGRSWPS